MNNLYKITITTSMDAPEHRLNEDYYVVAESISKAIDKLINYAKDNQICFLEIYSIKFVRSEIIS